MERPFYVHTPRNRYGESLVRSDNGVKYEILSVHTFREIHAEELNFEKAKKMVARLNDEHAASLYYAAGI